ncbi:hypothetical protein C7C46_26115 [Streptomyces tateyamensis]|uniref:Uncharacterized protein n=1 Tax=Streptomyces tateyamensis TaxID=565073 RepID=A0A2V4NA56_9ACTN|nr:hypothetical protein C7C46_26115 [Streptomyces tateyamensis]
MRSAVKPEEGGAEPEPPAPAPAPTGPRHRSAPSASPVLGVMDQGGRTAPPPDLPPEWRTPAPSGAREDSESTGEWFRPRQKGRPEPVASPAAPAAARAPRPTAAQAPAPAPAAAPGAPAGPAGGTPYQRTAEPGVRRSAAPRYAADSTQQTPPPQQGGNAGPPFGAPQGYPADPYAGGPRSPQGHPATPPHGTQLPGTPAHGTPRPAATPPHGTPVPGGPGQTGPYQAQNNASPYAPTPSGADPFAAAPTGADPFAPTGADPFAAAPATAPRPTGTPGAPGRFARPQPPINQPPAGGFPSGPAQGLALPDEGEDTQVDGFAPITADLPPHQAIPGLPATGGYGSAPTGPTGATPPGPLPAGATAPATTPAPAPKPAAPAAKKRSKAKKLLVTGTGGVVFLGAAVYGTGLMLNQSDVPRGTTVLGTDIGGDSRDQAVHQLDGTVGKAGQRPIQLKLGDQTLPLDPTTAGLSFDTTGTVDGLTKHSYAPADVFSSLTGGTKAVPPAVRIDRAKLKAALDSLASGAAHGLKEGFVQFDDSGNATVVPGQSGQTLDSANAADQVVQAYQDRAAGKPDQPVTLATTNAAPKVSTQALQQAADTLGKQITSAPVIVWAGTHRFTFTKVTAAKALTLAPDAGGTIGAKWDLDQLGSQLGTTFDKLKFRKSDGTSAPITPQDVADAIASVYDKNGTADRTFKFRM